MSSAMKRIVRVTIIKEIEIELTPAVFGPMTQDEYLKEFNDHLWNIDGIDDIFKYAAAMTAHHGGGLTHDGLGLLDWQHSTYPRVPDVKFKVLTDETEEELVEIVALKGGVQ